jgi:hypothetical protein
MSVGQMVFDEKTFNRHGGKTKWNQSVGSIGFFPEPEISNLAPILIPQMIYYFRRKIWHRDTRYNDIEPNDV